ncbi:pirin family protein [Caproicibacterium sp. BJN0003]|uniref:pirin family protein n=1 Tax=Caproicibacterium sp. BJN0003 TaxID=2994078 RepID=UPI0022566874|nr:pirin family protein [Caproicibacterium sp. BJN0003]UZT81742.1 pirin family protein [Caproicibacterium sp. BJN0003]
MIKRKIIKQIRGQKAVDGAGVHLVRVLGNNDVKDFDPFLMLDSFDSTNPSDYLAGFPMHPHRGIETITYLISGRIDHEDSLGNKGTIHPGECQWMTAGSGILHQEMPKESGRMLGFQLWLNLPREEKMATPAYCSLTRDLIPRINNGKAEIGILSGHFGEAVGITPAHIPATIYDIALPIGEDITIPTKANETVFVFLIEGDAVINEQKISSKSAVLFGSGDSITVSAQPQSGLRFIFFSGKALHEPIAWGGPIVMNTQEELMTAFRELQNDTFIKHS